MKRKDRTSTGSMLSCWKESDTASRGSRMESNTESSRLEVERGESGVQDVTYCLGVFKV